MKKLLLPVIGFMMVVLITRCKKDTDNAAQWVGTYVSSTTGADSVNQVTIAEVNSTTLQIQLQEKYNNVVQTFATIQSAKLTSATTISINETGNIAGYTALYTFTGSGVLSGNALTITGQAVNTTNSADVKSYYFTGSK